MGRGSTIEWTDNTFNPWWGCQRVSPGCQNCYAETLSKRWGHSIWGPPKTTSRRAFGDKHWNEPIHWNARAERAGVRERVFCASMADVFEDHPDLPPQRERLWRLIERTPMLDWQLLTKRPENVWAMLPDRWTASEWLPDNVWIGTSVEDQLRADERIPALLRIPASVLFLSCEPLLGPVELREDWTHQLDWIIIGGESGPGARPFNADWARALIVQARLGGARPFLKQLGSRPYYCAGGHDCPPACNCGQKHDCGGQSGFCNLTRQTDAKGGDWDEWPPHLRVREMPR